MKTFYNSLLSLRAAYCYYSSIMMGDSGQINESERKYMQRALALASKAIGMTSPNPMVGAVLVKNGRIISEGFHKKPGTPHAEVVAITRAGKMQEIRLYMLR